MCDVTGDACLAANAMFGGRTKSSVSIRVCGGEWGNEGFLRHTSRWRSIESVRVRGGTGRRKSNGTTPDGGDGELRPG